MTDTAKSEIENAFRRLQIPTKNEWRLPLIVDALSAIPKKANGIPPPQFRLKGRKACRSELNNIAALAYKLAFAIGDLAEPSIGVLADAGLLNVVHHNELAKILMSVAAIAKNAKVDQIPEKQGSGRPRDYLVEGISNILAVDYTNLTGKNPTVSTKNDGNQDLPYGDFFDLVKDIFSVLEIDASAEAAARSAVKKFKDKKSL